MRYLCQPLIAVLLLALASGFNQELSAQDGGQLYNQFCMACHGQAGEGNGQAGIPPLAQSPWVAGDPARMINIVLHGLAGPVNVNGKTYNGMMPPQGAMLNDSTIAAIANYVRSSFGNQPASSDPKVTTDLVKRLRQKHKDQKVPWQAEELLEKYPLPKAAIYLDGLSAVVTFGNEKPGKTYKVGDINQHKVVPKLGYDRKKAYAAALRKKDKKLKGRALTEATKYGITYTGTLHIQKDGQYNFFFAGDYEAEIRLGEKRLFSLPKGTKISKPKEKTMQLRKGKQPLKMMLKERRGGDMLFAWKAPDKPAMNSLVEGATATPWDPIDLTPNQEVQLYRNYLKDSGSTRAIAAALPTINSMANMNIIFNPETMSPSLVWAGQFMDAGRHWSNRGGGEVLPIGRNLVKLFDSAAAWQSDNKIAMNFGGFIIDPDRKGLTFLYTLNNTQVKDHFRASGPNVLERKIKFKGGVPKELWLTLFEHTQVKAINNGYQVGKLKISASAPLTIDKQGSMQLAKAKVSGGDITITYSAK